MLDSVYDNRNIALIGATGVVGRKVLELLLKRSDGRVSVELFASRFHQISVQDKVFKVRSVEDVDFSKFDLCLFATEQDVSCEWIPRALDAGARVVDSSSWRRLDPEVPLIVPGVNEDILSSGHKLCAHSNCVVSPLAQIIAPLQNVYGVESVHVATYQSVSGAGKRGVETCLQETQRKLEGEVDASEASCFPRSIGFNVIPQIGIFSHEGHSSEEEKIEQELQKILGIGCPVWNTAVRVPVLQGHASALWLEFQREADLDDIQRILEKSTYVQMSSHYITPVEVQGKEVVCLGRIRQLTPFRIAAWVCSDNILRGAASDMVDIAERMLYQMA